MFSVYVLKWKSCTVLCKNGQHIDLTYRVCLDRPTHTHTYFHSLVPLLPPPSPALFSPSILWLTVRVEAGWKAVSGAILPIGQRKSDIHNVRVRGAVVMARPLGSRVLLIQINHSWEKKNSGKERGRNIRGLGTESKPTQKLCRIMAKNTIQCKSLLNTGTTREGVQKEEWRVHKKCMQQ